MVGVPGKYKGCETCRRRRVTCTNERPFCRKCITSGRECEGYERERVFITGTPEGRGRVASHPKRVTPPKKQASKSPQPKREPSESQSPKFPQSFSNSPTFSQATLNNSAWDDNLDLANGGKNITALHTSLHTIVRSPATSADGQGFGIALPPYSPVDLHNHHAAHVANADVPLWVSAQCLLCHRGIQGGSQSTDSYCVFLFEQTSPNANWGIASESLVKRLGPSNFTSFPNHQFFVRVYRPIGVCLALLNRRETFLSDLDWTSLPWKNHRKSSLDSLFDIILRLPAVFAHTDLLIPQAVSIDRRYKAQSLLQTCLTLELQFAAWLGQAMGSPEQFQAMETAASISNVYNFHDELTAFTLLYYWMSQILFHRCIEDLCEIIYQPVLDSYTEMWPTLPVELQIDPERYRDGRILAAKICRGLDSALSCTAQPDMLVAPMTVALDFYRDLQMTSQDGIFESMELELFRTRLIEKGQGVANILQGQIWDEIAEF